MSLLSRRFFLSVLILAALASSAFAATPREELLRLVPEGAGFCVVVQNLRDHAERLAASPFVADFLVCPLGEAIRSSAEMRQLVDLEKQLTKQFGVDWLKLRDEVFG